MGAGKTCVTLHQVVKDVHFFSKKYMVFDTKLITDDVLHLWGHT